MACTKEAVAWLACTTAQRSRVDCSLEACRGSRRLVGAEESVDAVVCIDAVGRL
jgi:hypothetical protein